jgi:hypothetical protein
LNPAPSPVKPDAVLDFLLRPTFARFQRAFLHLSQEPVSFAGRSHIWINMQKKQNPRIGGHNNGRGRRNAAPRDNKGGFQ